jgi:putative acetyltransferase
VFVILSLKEGDSTMIIIRPEKFSDHDSINEIVTEAFGESGELVAELVEFIRKSENYVPELSLVAEVHGRVLGHLMLSHLNLDDGVNLHQVLTLSPISVTPLLQKQGVGSALIKEAIRKADEIGEPLIVLEGSPKYYPRFGFKYAEPYQVKINLPHWAPKEAAMVYLLSNYKTDIKGKVIYPSAFDKVNADSHNRPVK